MTDFLSQSNSRGLIKISGKIENYIKKRDSASFVFTKSDQTKMGVIAIGAALAGMDGQASAIASNISSVEEDADHVEFKIGSKTIKGWLWRSPFSDGDEVDVAAEWQGEHYEIFGMARANDSIISLYPHCSRSKIKHIKNAIKWWIVISVVVHLFVLLMFSIPDGLSRGLGAYKDIFEKYGLWWSVGVSFVFGIPVVGMARQWMPFVSLAEKIFRTLELPYPGDIDLVKSSKGRHTDQDTPEFGVMYFRY